MTCPICQICRRNPADLAWQPYGPDDSKLLTRLGSHYRGFPVFKVCEVCAEQIRSGVLTEPRAKEIAR